MAGDRASDAPRSDRPATQHLVLLWGICRTAPRPHGRIDRAAAEVPRAQPQLWKRATLSHGGLLGDRETSRSGRDGSIIPRSISGLPVKYVRTIVAVAFGLCHLSRSGPAIVRENPLARCGELRVGS